MQTAEPTTITAGTRVKTTGGRYAVTVDDSTVVRNSESGLVTTTNLIRFDADDHLSPNAEWIWLTDQLTVVHNLRLIDGEGYTVPVGIRINVPDTDVNKVRQCLLNDVAAQDVAQWAAWGFDSYVRDYRVVTY